MEQDVIQFIKGYDFMRLGQAISHQQWQAAAMTLRRMEMQAKKPELACFARQFAGIRQAIMRKAGNEAKQILAQVTAKRVRMLEQIRKEEQEQKEN